MSLQRMSSASTMSILTWRLSSRRRTSVVSSDARTLDAQSLAADADASFVSSAVRGLSGGISTGPAPLTELSTLEEQPGRAHDAGSSQGLAALSPQPPSPRGAKMASHARRQSDRSRSLSGTLSENILDSHLRAVTISSVGEATATAGPALRFCSGPPALYASTDLTVTGGHAKRLSSRALSGGAFTALVDTTTVPTDFTEAPLRTLDAGGAKEQLLYALDNMASRQPPEPFAKRYLLMRERVTGGQAVVNFARDEQGSFFQYAIKCVTKLPHLPARCSSTPSAPTRVYLCSRCVCPASTAHCPRVKWEHKQLASCK